MTRKYTNIGLPDDIIKKIDQIIIEGKLGYTSRSEFVKESIRDLLLKLIALKNYEYRKKRE